MDLVETVLSHGKDIVAIKSNVKNLKEKVDDLQDIKSAVIELALLSKQQIEHNVKFTETYQNLVVSNTKFAVTLENINCNLEVMNQEVKKTNEQIKKTNERIDDIDVKGKIDTIEVCKKAIPYLLLSGVTFWALQLAGVISF